MIRSSDIPIEGDVFWDLVGTWECLQETFFSWQMVVIGELTFEY